MDAMVFSVKAMSVMIMSDNVYNSAVLRIFKSEYY